jgi:hypothetical protein
VEPQPDQQSLPTSSSIVRSRPHHFRSPTATFNRTVTRTDIVIRAGRQLFRCHRARRELSVPCESCTLTIVTTSNRKNRNRREAQLASRPRSTVIEMTTLWYCSAVTFLDLPSVSSSFDRLFCVDSSHRTTSMFCVLLTSHVAYLIERLQFALIDHSVRLSNLDRTHGPNLIQPNLLDPKRRLTRLSWSMNSLLGPSVRPAFNVGHCFELNTFTRNSVRPPLPLSLLRRHRRACSSVAFVYLA